MDGSQVYYGVRAIIKSLSVREEEKTWKLLRFVAAQAGWFLILFVGGVYLLSPELRERGPWIYRWLAGCLVYQVLREAVSWIARKFYETSLFRMVRVQVMVFLGSVLILLTNGAESYFWFIYLWPLFASTLYLPWAVMWVVYGEVAALYFLSSLIIGRGITLSNFALLFTNLVVLFVLVVIFRCLVESIKQYQMAERKLKYFEILQQTQQDIDTAIDLQEVLNRILRRAVELVGVRDGSLMLMDEGELRFRARFGRSLPEGEVEQTFKPGEGIAGWVVQSRRPYICHDAKTDPCYVPLPFSRMTIRSLISVPIISHGTVLGVINVDSPELERFSGTDADLLVALADQAAVAIERAELLEGLRQIGEKILDGVEAPYQHIVDTVHWLTHCPVAMWRMDQTRKQARIVASQGVKPEYTQEAVVDLDRKSVTAKAIHERRIVQVPDIQADPDFQNKEVAAREGWQSYLAVPLLAGPDRAVGTLSIYSERKREQFTRWELDLLRTFAGQAGVVTRNADLVKELAVLNRIGQSVSVLGVEAIANLVYQETSQLMDTNNFFLCLYDKEKEELHYRIWMYDGQPLEPFSSRVTGLTGWIVQEKRSLLIRDWDKEEQDFPVKADIVTERQRSWLGVPLLIGEEVLGVMNVQSPHPNAFDLDTQRLLETVANQAAVVVENARLYEETQDRLELLDALHETSLDIVKQPKDLDELIPVIIKRAANLMAGERHEGVGAAYWRCDHGTQRAIIEYSPNPTLKGVELGFDEGLVGEVIRTGQARYVNDYHLWEGRAAVFDKEDLAGLIKNIVEVPVRQDGKVVAILAISDASGQRLFGDADIEFLKRFANLVTIAIQNAHLYEQLQEELQQTKVLYEIGQAFSAEVEPQRLLALILGKVKGIIPFESGSIALIDERLKELVTMGSIGLPEGSDLLRTKIGEGITGWVVKYGRPLRVADVRDIPEIPDVSEQPGYIELDENTRSELCVPLRAKGQIIGVLNLESRQVGAFDERDQEQLETLAGQAAIALENVRRQQRLEQLNKATQALLAVRDPAMLLKHIAVEARKVLGADVVVLYEYFEVREDVGIPPTFDGSLLHEDVIKERSKALPHKNSAVFSVLQLDEPYYASEAASDWANLGIAGYSEGSRDNFVVREGIKSSVGFPLISGGERVGVLFVNYRNSQTFFPDVRNLMELFAGAAALAIRDARFFRDAQRRIQDLEIINDVAKIISTKLDTGDLLSTIVSQVADGLNCTHCTLFLAQEENGERLLVPQVTHGLFSDQIMERRFKLGEGVAGWVFQHGESMIFDDVKGDPRFLPAAVERDQPRSMLVAPVKVGDQAIGVISADQDEYGWFGENDRRLVDALARHAGIAIERAIGLELLQDIGSRVINLQNVGGILQQIVSGAIKLTNTNTGVIYLISEDGQSVTDSFYPSGFEHPRPRLEMKEGLTRHVIGTGEVLSIPDIRQDPRVNPVLLDYFQSMIAVPLKIEEKVIGVLYLNDKDPHDFTETEISLMSTLASQAAIAIENARLYKQLKVDLSTTEKQQEALRSLLSVNQIAGRFVHRVSQLVGTVPVEIEFIQDMLHPGLPNYEEAYKDLETIRTQVQEVLDMVRRVRDSVMKLEEFQYRQRVEASELLDRALAEIRGGERMPSWGGQIKIAKDYRDQPLIIETFEPLFTEALGNLISNAIEAMPQGGTLTLRTERGPTADTECAVLTVADTGMGIPEGTLERIFVMGYSTKPRSFGYGLWLVKQICDATAIRIEVKSAEGSGSAFRLVVPLVAR